MRKLICAVLCIIASHVSFAQGLGTGNYNFASFDSRGFDAVNLGNLNVRFSIPIVNKQGRGMPFNYALQYEGLIWSATNVSGVTTWTPDPTWGFTGTLNGTAFSGYITYSTKIIPCPRPAGWSHNVPPSATFYNYQFHDSLGGVHGFNYQYVGACPLSNDSDQIVGDGSNPDGYKLLDGGTVKTPSGTVIVPAQSATGNDPTQITDTNGNQMQANGTGGFTDTLGTTPLTISGSNPVNFTYPVTLQQNSNTTASTAVYYQTYTVQTNFQCANIAEYGTNSVALIDHITQADGSEYQFTYETTPGIPGAVTGRLASVTLPTGGTISYQYIDGCNGSGITADGSVGSLKRVTSDGNRTYTRVPINANASTTNLVDEKGNTTSLDFTIESTTLRFYETRRFVDQTGVSGDLLGVFTCYNGATAPCSGGQVSLPITVTSAVTSYNNGSQDEVRNGYDASTSNLTLSRQSIFNSSTLAQTVYSYDTSGNLDIVSTSDGTSQVSQTSYDWDEGSVTGTTSVPQHGGTISGPRRNLTSTHVYVGSGTLDTTVQYDDTGMPTSSMSPSGSTGFTYDSTHAFVTQTTFPTPSSAVGLSTSASYDAASGAPVSSTGMNSDTTTVLNYDTMLRPSLVQLPNGSQVSYQRSSPNSSWVQQDLSATNTAITLTLLDAYGRLSRTFQYNGQQANAWYQVDYCYDQTGLLSFQSAVYQSTGAVDGNGHPTPKHCSGSGTAYQYDALGRVTSKTTDYGTSYTAYNNRAVKTTSLNEVQRITQYDLLGRVSGVCEVSSSNLGTQTPTNCGMDIAGTGYLTQYSYDMANHTTTINQGGQIRTFQTDAAGRTIATSEPERGSTTYSYTYNSTGLQVTRTRPQPNQSNSSVLTNTINQYDSLGRLASVSYVNDGGVTPNKSFFYDMVPTGQGWTGTTSNVKGRLAVMASGSGSTLARSLYSYDQMGKITYLAECAPSLCNGNQDALRQYFQYDLGENLTLAGDYTSGDIAYTRSPAGEVTSISNQTYNDPNNPPNLISNLSNGPGGPVTFSLGTSINVFFLYDGFNNLNGKWYCYGSEQINCPVEAYSYDVSRSGNRITAICDTSLNQCQSHGYDDFGRLTSVTATSGSGPGNSSYSYDRWGNRLTQTSLLGTVSPTYNSNNQINGLSYDAAGNLLNDGAQSYNYDAEGNLISVNGGNTAKYVYDAANHRVRSETSAGVFEYTYNPSGQRVTRFNVAGNTGDEGRIYWDDTPIAYRGQDGTTYFEHQDWLGSERLRTNAQGQKVMTGTALAFGDDMHRPNNSYSAGQDIADYAGMDFDIESSTEHATFRQYLPSQGRWSSPDPYDGSYNFSNPQSFNRYNYTLNKPLSLTDPFGLNAQCSNGKNWKDDNTVCDNPPPPSDICGLDCLPIGYIGPLGGGGYEGGGPSSSVTPAAPNNTENPPPCQAKILSATNNQFGTNYTDANVSNTFNYSTGAGPGQGTLNLNITGSTAGVSPGYYPVHWYSYIIGYGPTLHVVSGPGGNGGLDSQMTVPFGPNQGTFHIDSAFPHNPFGAIIHGIMNMTKLAGYPKC